MEFTLSGFVGDHINNLRFGSPCIAHVIKYCGNIFSQVTEAVLFTHSKTMLIIERMWPNHLTS